MKQIVIINGPNLNLVGIREPSVYGNRSLAGYLEELRLRELDINLIVRQTNVEGEVINLLHEFGFTADGIILNPGGYAHTSVAIADAIRSIPGPVVEVHLSNVSSRETFRHTLLTGAACVGVISGFGLEGYAMAVNYLKKNG